MANSFAGYNQPFINGATLKRLYSKVVKENIFQNIFTRNGEAVMEKYCEDTSVAQVTVLRIIPGDGIPRSMGGATNNGFFNNADAVINQTVAYPINLLDLIDYQTDIPEVQQDMMSTDLAAARASILGGQVAKAVNAITIAAQLAKNFNDIANGTITSNWVTLAASPATGAYLQAIVDAGAKLDNGNPDEGIDTYPTENRAIYVTASFKALLFGVGNVIVGGSNYAQDIIKAGGLSVGDKSDTVTGFCGRLLDMPVYMMGEATVNLVELYLGLAKGALSGVNAVVVSGIGTGRGLAFNASIKQINSYEGAGIRMQPLYRFGAECWDGASVVPIVANGFSNPSTSGANLSVAAPGSRIYTITFDKNTGTGTQANVTGKYKEVKALPTNTFTAPSTKSFSKWGTKADGTGTNYDAGDDFTLLANTTLYAIWA